MSLSKIHISKKATIIVASSVAVVLLIGGTTVYAANSSALPGSFLYPLKQGWENISLAFASTPQSKAEIHVNIARDRIQTAADSTVAAPVLAPTLLELENNLDSALEQSKQVTSTMERKEIQESVKKEASRVESEVRHGAESESSHVADAKNIKKSSDAIKKIQTSSSAKYK